MLDSVLAPVGVAPRAVHRVQLTEAIVYMAAAGWGVSALARWMVEPYLVPSRLAAVRIGRRGLLRQWRVAFRNADPRAADFSRLARAVARRFVRDNALLVPVCVPGDVLDFEGLVRAVAQSLPRESTHSIDIHFRVIQTDTGNVSTTIRSKRDVLVLFYARIDFRAAPAP